MPALEFVDLLPHLQTMICDYLSFTDVAMLGMVSDRYEQAMKQNSGRSCYSCQWTAENPVDWTLQLYPNNPKFPSPTIITSSDPVLFPMGHDYLLKFAKSAFQVFNINKCSLKVSARINIQHFFVILAWTPNEFDTLELTPVGEWREMSSDDFRKMLQKVKIETLITHPMRHPVKISGAYTFDTIVSSGKPWFDGHGLVNMTVRDITIQRLRLRDPGIPSRIILEWYRGSMPTLEWLKLDYQFSTGVDEFFNIILRRIPLHPEVFHHKLREMPNLTSYRTIACATVPNKYAIIGVRFPENKVILHIWTERPAEEALNLPHVAQGTIDDPIVISDDSQPADGGDTRMEVDEEVEYTPYSVVRRAKRN